MSAFGPPNSRQTAIVDPAASGLADASGNLIGIPMPSRADRTVWALWLNAPQSVTLRYQPNHPPEETCNFWLDVSFVVPFGVALTGGSLSIFTNAAVPAAADADWTKGPVTVFGRAVYALLGGGKAGTDYQFRWTATDGLGNTWTRTALCLCAETG